MEPIDEFMDRRRYRRIATEGNARINFDGFWHNCPVIDLSGGGGSFRSWLQPVEGSNVLVQIRGIGVIRARVIRRWDQGFAVHFDAEDYDAGTLVDNLTLPANPGVLGPGSNATREKSTANAPEDEPSAARDNGEEESAAQSAGEYEARDAEQGSGRHPLRSFRKVLG